MLKDLRTCFLGLGGTKDAFLANPPTGDPLARFVSPSDGRRGGLDGWNNDTLGLSSVAESGSAKLRRVGVDALALEPNWKGGSNGSRAE